MSEWLSMGGHGFFIWSSYGMLALALVIEIMVLRRSRRSASDRARAMRADATQP
ncbi:MAG: heme exporter protein CcmD [Betaproteobacteria bacterium]|nr:heme exporter protein CcmD [Betaproteobacteria bacterium]